jgi:Ion channel
VIHLGAIREFSPANRYGMVVLLIAVTYVVTAGAHGSTAQAAIVLVQLLTVWIVFSVSESRRARRLTSSMIVVVAVVAVAGLVVGSVRTFDDVRRGLFVVSALLYLVAPVVIVRHIFRRSVVDGQTVLGAIAAYLLLGMMFAFCYEAIAAIQTAPPFFGGNDSGSPGQDLFFSFVTLTTTGYGDLVPAANPGQTVAVLEAIAGQLFLVTAVAKVITAWRTPAERRREDEHPGGSTARGAEAASDRGVSRQQPQT